MTDLDAVADDPTPPTPPKPDEPNDEATDKRPWWLKHLGLIGLGVLIGLTLIYGAWMMSQNQTLLPSPETADWGTFGDFIGGVANPIMALLALLGLLETIRQQKNEFGHVKTQLEAQNTLQKQETAITLLHRALAFYEAEIHKHEQTTSAELTSYFEAKKPAYQVITGKTFNKSDAPYFTLGILISYFSRESFLETEANHQSDFVGLYLMFVNQLKDIDTLACLYIRAVTDAPMTDLWSGPMYPVYERRMNTLQTFRKNFNKLNQLHRKDQELLNENIK